MAGVGPEHPNTIGGIPGEVVVMQRNAVTVIHRHTVVLHRHGVIDDVDCSALVHHHPAAQGQGVVGPYIDPPRRISLVPTKHIAVDGDMVGIGDIDGIFVVKYRIEIFNDHIVRIVDFYHVAGRPDTVNPATVTIKHNVLYAVDLDHPVGRGIGKYIVPCGELDVRVAADDHVIADGKVGLCREGYG